MTQYDPFSYGQVPLSQKGQAPASPEDLLFADAATTTPPPPTARSAAKTATKAIADESDWAPVTDDGFGAVVTPGAPTPQSTANALAFGAEVLGEVAPPAPVAAPAPRKPAAPPRAARAPKDPHKPKEALPRRLPEPLPVPPKGVSALGAASSTAFAAAGLAWAAWLFFAAANPILAAIVAAASVVGGAMSWLLLRR